MALRAWTYDRAQWPPEFGRLWLWTMFAERVNQDRVVRIATEVGATDVVILLNDSPKAQPAFGYNPSRAAVLELAQKLHDADIGVHLGSWLDPKKAYVDAAGAGLCQLAKETKAKSICLDLEGEWRKRIKNHTQFVAETVAPAFAGCPVPIGITSFAALPKEVAPALAWAVAKHNGYGMPQAYAVDTGAAWQKAANVQPDTIAGLAWRTWSPITENLVCLAAAYGKTQAGWEVASALEAQLMRAEYEGFPEVGVWTEESLIGDGPTAKTRRQVLAELDISGRSKVVRPSIAPLIIGGVATAAVGVGALTRKRWLRPLVEWWRGR